MDEVLVELLSSWLEYLEVKTGLHRSIEDIVEWDMRKAYPNIPDDVIFEPLTNPDFWKNVSPVKGAYYYLKTLKEEGNEIYVATSSYPESFHYKMENCLLKHFDFLTPKDIICTHHKNFLIGDLLFDDYPENLRNFNGVRVLKDTPYNKSCDESYFDFRINNWAEFYCIVNDLKILADKHFIDKK